MLYGEYDLPQAKVTIKVQGAGQLDGECEVDSKHNRDWITLWGAQIPQSGAWWICKGGKPGETQPAAWPTNFNRLQYAEGQGVNIGSSGKVEVPKPFSSESMACWSKSACGPSGCHACKSRFNYVVGNMGKSKKDAVAHIKAEFPNICNCEGFPSDNIMLFSSLFILIMDRIIFSSFFIEWIHRSWFQMKKGSLQNYLRRSSH